MIANRGKSISPFIVMEVMEKAFAMEREGHDISHMEVGEPDFDTPQCIKDAAHRAMLEGRTHYTDSRGVLELREAISRHYFDKYNVEVDPERIIITNGSSPAMLLLFAALLDPGQEVILSNPCYACYPNIIEFVEGKPVEVPVFEEDGFQYRAEEIKGRLGPKVKGILINSPSNPTGNLLEPEVMQEIAAMGKPGRYIVSDEIYHGLVYERKEHSILEFTDNAFVINGFSKLYAMTGWRLGYLIAPEQFVRPIQKMMQNLFISANSFVQWAGIAALQEAGEEVAAMVRTYDERRRFLLPRLNEIGLKVAVEPHGAFYILANAKRFTDDSYNFAMELLEKARVATAPGIDFGTGAEGYIRFSYANHLENLAEGTRRLQDYLVSR
ncbi:MAG: aspartate aminotransferase [Candidatus Solincola sediminis]|uniref:Aminotransferase n=1 Tax=Candidatus Solincola sediminis TaxID=1797199 RepID=A0A1F2WQ01_9ACTN|nr:MAG: aspartate aminotransferase [Candidatus Solincola sediminis]OFW58957.1 MAG: aspartate aminotransferase [Candidatus Solincola sediminis]